MNVLFIPKLFRPSLSFQSFSSGSATGSNAATPGNVVLGRLQERGLVQDATAGSVLPDLVPPQTVYCGFDPTADSIHVGNLALVSVLRHFQLAGIAPVALVGGATGLLGDPSGRSTERNLLPLSTVSANAARLSSLFHHLLSPNQPSPPPPPSELQSDLEAASIPWTLVPSGNDLPTPHIVDNATWTAQVSMMDFLRDVGKHFRVSSMLAKDSVKSRMEKDGISFTEFSYQLFQANDFLQLLKSHSTTVQIGGADQWGNLTAGVDFVRRAAGVATAGLTVPLLTTADGEKIGKSMGNATMWLHGDKMPPYDLYQSLLATDDESVQRFLGYFTLLTRDAIQIVMSKHRAAPEERLAQKILAHHLVSWVHGDLAANSAQQASQVVFGSSDGAEALAQARGIDATIWEQDLASGTSQITSLLVSIGLASSKKAARRLIEGGGVSVADHKITDPTAVLSRDLVGDSSVFLVKVGKRNLRAVAIE